MHKFKKLLLIILIAALACPLSLYSYEDIYDISGRKIFEGDLLFEMDAEASIYGGTGRNWGHWDRFLRDFGSSVTLHEWINGRDYELILGRCSTWFTPLTLHKERFRWGYYGGYYNSWEWTWGRWWDQRNMRLRMTKGENEWTALVAKTGLSGWNYSDDDQWWDPDLEYNDQYMTALRRKTKISGYDIGMSFVNEHYTNFTTAQPGYPGVFTSEGPMTGTLYNVKDPRSILFKFTDDSPVDEAGSEDLNGAAIFDIRVFVNGVEDDDYRIRNGRETTASDPNISVWGTYDTSNNDFVEVSGPYQDIYYGFNIPLAAEVKEITFLITAANDYKIEVERMNGRYEIISRAQGNVRDLSNKKVITYNYGENTGTTILSFDIAGVIPAINAPFTAEMAASKKFYQYPTLYGKRYNDIGKAWHVRASKEFFPVFMSCEVYDYDYSYDAAFAVEDNDDYDDKPDLVDDYVAWWGDNVEGIRFDEVLYLFAYDDRFREGLDLNNNIAFDREENDASPDYPFNAGQKGLRIGSAIKPMPEFKIQGHYINEQETMSQRRNITLFGKAKYKFSLDPFALRLRYEIKNSRDNIPDPLVYSPNGWPQPYASQTYEDWKDQAYPWDSNERKNEYLQFRDTTENKLISTMEFKLFQNLLIMPRYLYSKTDKYFKYEEVFFQDGVLRLMYVDWFPFKGFKGFEKWEIKPSYKFERTREYTVKEDYRWATEEERIDAFQLVAANKLTENTSFDIGEQIVITDDLMGTYDNTTYIFQTQVVHKNTYWDRPILVTGGIKFYNKLALMDDEDYSYEWMYVKAYFQW